MANIIRLNKILGSIGFLLLGIQLLNGFIDILKGFDPLVTIIIIGITIYFISKGMIKW